MICTARLADVAGLRVGYLCSRSSCFAKPEIYGTKVTWNIQEFFLIYSIKNLKIIEKFPNRQLDSMLISRSLLFSEIIDEL